VSDVVEQYTIRPIPDSQRHGTARSLFPRGVAPSAAGQPAEKSTA